MILVVDKMPDGIKIWRFKNDGSSSVFYLEDEYSTAENLKKAVYKAVGRAKIECISFRVFFGGEIFDGPVLIGPDFFISMEKLKGSFPMHLPAVMSMIQLFYEAFRENTLIAFFENSFFKTLPDEEKYYALAAEYCENNGIRKWGFHGIFHEANAGFAALGGKTISIVFDKQTTVAAVRGMEPLSISLGYTPLEGVMSRTSSGDLDPGIVLYLMTFPEYSLNRIDDILKNESGFLGLTGYDIGMDEMIKLLGKDKKVDLAFDIYISQIMKYIGEGLSVLGGLDNIIFAGINAVKLTPVIHRILKDMTFLGVNMVSLPWEGEEGILRVSSSESKINVYINKKEIAEIIFVNSKLFLRSKAAYIPEEKMS